MSWPAVMILVIGSLMTGPAPQGDAGKTSQAVPDRLRPPHGQVLLFKAKAVGVQIYVCKAKVNDPDHFEWVLKGPDADLFDETGRQIGRHYAGPTWASSDGASKVVGELISQAPAPKHGDIPWLLLKAKAGAGAGPFSRVAYIQRVDTEGGILPSQGSDRTDQGREVRVKYKATYRFYGPDRS